MPDFKGRKDFPEVDDKKIKIGDYSGTNRLSVIDIFSPKEKPELRDQMIEPMKGNKPNNYDSPMLSQQPVIVLSDDESEEATLIKAIINDVEEAVLSKAINTVQDLLVKDRRPHPNDGNPKDDKHPMPGERDDRPQPPRYPKEKRDPMPDERKRVTLGKAAGDPKVHISSEKAQKQIEEYLAQQAKEDSTNSKKAR